MKRYITILGSTGSIGKQALDIISRNIQEFSVVALTANSNVNELYKQCKKFNPIYAVVGDFCSYKNLAGKIYNSSLKTMVLFGENALCKVSAMQECDTVLCALVGSIGLSPTIAAARSKKRILLANKESLVIGGEILIKLLEKPITKDILPIDSEHNSIFQCSQYFSDRSSRSSNKGFKKKSEVDFITLTASGGPFRKKILEKIKNTSPENAILHPNWNMGKKTSIDSATMMNKGFEVIEAAYFFNLTSKKIKVITHPQSLVHGFVHYSDGSVISHFSKPDMRVPISNTLLWPKRINSGVKPLKPESISNLEFLEIEKKRYPCLSLAYQVLSFGGTSSSSLNASNECAVSAFLLGKIKFFNIARIIYESVAIMPIKENKSLKTVLEADSVARHITNLIIKHLQGKK